MNVLLISQCNKRALSETRRILDQFAERRGERTWQTPITMQGLQTLHKMLRKTARKNTAVACHWIRGKDHSELIWIVGDASRFNAQGATPTNTTQRDVLRNQDENDWHSAEDIRLLASMAALFHDLGKSNNAFQKKLSSRKPIADAYRHEWVSLRLFEAFIGDNTDEHWLQRLAELTPARTSPWLQELKRDGIDKRIYGPFKSLRDRAPLAQLIGWLIVSHHRMPAPDKDDSPDLKSLPNGISADWCGANSAANDKDKQACWSFKRGLPFASKHWCEHVSKLATLLLQRPQLLTTQWLDNAYVIHVSRLALMLADHYYSAQPSQPHYGDTGFPLIANTRGYPTTTANQRLDEHLVGVEVNASRIVKTLPRMARQLAHIARHKGFRQRTKVSRFRWQDKAFDLATSLQRRAAERGFFGVNMASTGCGKTLANGRIMYGLADSQKGARFNIALGLRTLTLQTGEAYRSRLGLSEEDLAVLVGGGAIRALFEKQREQSALALAGAESSEDLLAENHYVHFEGSLEDGPLNRWLGNNRDAQKLLNAPILTCTIDHLIPATEGTRGGRQIAPMLRLMSADLILDEPDDFALEDLPALTRLVNWAGMLGCRVLLSSATLPPALVQGLFQAYLAGRKVYQRNRGTPGAATNICCAWFDEFGCRASDAATSEVYLSIHQQFVTKRLQQLSKAALNEQRRRAVIKPLEIKPAQPRETVCTKLGEHLQRQMHELHDVHSEQEPSSNKKVSFGLIRMANIQPLVSVAQTLYRLGGQEGYQIHLCVYHSQHPLLVRSAIEKRLDRLLTRDQTSDLFADHELRRLLNLYPEQNHIFVILATPVAEVGRDHDYDWAIVEPSSMRSIIQLAGRVRRHRKGNIAIPNLYLLDTNVRHLEQGDGKPAFCRPGFESTHFPLNHHHLTRLLRESQISVIDASMRIQMQEPLQPQQNLVDLEHASLSDLMLGATKDTVQQRLPVMDWWQTRAHLSGHLQQKQPFRHDPIGRQRYALLLDEDDQPHFHLLTTDGLEVPQGNLLHPVEVEAGPRIRFWGAANYLDELNALAESFGMDPMQCARRFGYVDLPEDTNGRGWHYHEAIGFWRIR